MTPPRLAFLGLGWIGRHRMQSLIEANAGEVVAVADSDPEALQSALRIAPGAAAERDLRALLAHEPDAIVIATPSALHAAQALAALERGIAVFCQKPLARNAPETRRVLDAARAADRLLSVDLSYRFTDAMAKIRELCRAGELGEVYAASLAFHNAYGPDKPWFYDRALAGGGALIDLGTHLLDLALWVLGRPRVTAIASQLYAGGAPLARGSDDVEDCALAQLELSSGTVLQLACSWKLHAGRDCAIEASFYGTRGGARFHNVGGSFYDFAAELLCGTASRPLAAPPDAWGGRALCDFAARLARSRRFDPEALELLDLAEAIDGIYERGRREARA